MGPLLQVELLKVGTYVRLRPLSWEAECFCVLWAKYIEDSWVSAFEGATDSKQYKETWQSEHRQPRAESKESGTDLREPPEVV